MEDILAIILIFGGGTVCAISFSPIGRAISDRIRGRSAQPEPDPEVLDELERLRNEMVEVQERLDFTERLLTEASALPNPADPATP